MKTYPYSALSAQEIKTLCQRTRVDLTALVPLLKNIQNDIRKNGDKALRKYTRKFDGVEIDSFLVSSQEYEASETLVSPEFKEAIATAAQNIEAFHTNQISVKKRVQTSNGILCWQENRPIDKVGLYIPGGTAPLFSTLLMTALPAQIAGCREIIVCTPPKKDGSIAPEILYTAQFLGLNAVYKVGGAQAIFALAEGTESLPRVDKIFGPGNQYVTAAKMMISNNVAIDMPAGPSEVLVIADKTSNPEFVASDLLSQAEHGADSEVVLVTNSAKKAQAILKAINEQLRMLPRKKTAKKALEKSFVVLTENLDQAFVFSNLYAPEHLVLAFKDFEPWIPKITNAGSVFCGPFTCESFGDYASGTNHVLPTSGFARSFSGLNLDSFLKKISFQEVTAQGCLTLGPVVEILAEKEALQAHKNAVTIRRLSLKETP